MNKIKPYNSYLNWCFLFKKVSPLLKDQEMVILVVNWTADDLEEPLPLN